MNQDDLTRNEVLALAAKHHVAYVAYAFGILKNWSNAKDAVQESYVVVAMHWEKYRAGTPIFHWVCRIIQNKCYDQRRASKKEYAFSNEYIESLMDEELIKSLSEGKPESLEARIQALSSCIQTLNSKSQNLLHEFYVRGRRCMDLASEGGAKAESFNKQLFRIRKRLRSCIYDRLSRSYEDREDIGESEDQEAILDEYFIRNQKEKALLKGEWAGNLTAKVVGSYLIEASVFWFALECVFKRENEGGSETALEPIDFHVGVNQPLSFLEVEPVGGIGPFKGCMFRESPKLLGLSLRVVACILLGVGLAYWQLGQEQVIARIASGSAILNRTKEGIGRELKAGDYIRIGQELVAGASTLQIQYLREATHLSFEGGGEVHFLAPIEGSFGKRIHLKAGELEADVFRQGEGEPMIVSTPHMELTVLGTRFKLSVTPANSIVSLESGRILLREYRSGKNLILGEGKYASVHGDNITKGILENWGRKVEEDVREDGLIGLYHFEAGEGMIVKDDSPFQANGRLGAVLENTWVPGIRGKALSFDGFPSATGNFLVFPEFPKGHITDTLSVSLWILRHSDGRRGDVIANNLISCYDDGAGWLLMVTEISNGGKYRMLFRVNGSNKVRKPSNIAVGTTWVKVNEWQHIGIIFDRGAVQFYVNGILSNEERLEDTVIKPVVRGEMRISPTVGVPEPPDIAVDEVSICNRLLSVEEMSQKGIR